MASLTPLHPQLPPPLPPVPLQCAPSSDHKVDLQLLLSGAAAAIRMIRVHLLSDTYLRVVGQEGLPQKNPRLSLKAADLLIVWPIATWTELNNVL